VQAPPKAGESEERVFAVAAWRETPYFSDAGRAALALTEAQLGALVLDIATVNLWNRLHIATRQVVGSP
jgi:alkylhydroperoxidase family enzyme